MTKITLETSARVAGALALARTWTQDQVVTFSVLLPSTDVACQHDGRNRSTFLLMSRDQGTADTPKLSGNEGGLSSGNATHRGRLGQAGEQTQPQLWKKEAPTQHGEPLTCIRGNGSPRTCRFAQHDEQRPFCISSGRDLQREVLCSSSTTFVHITTAGW